MYDDPPQAIDAAQRARKVLEKSGADDPGLISDSLNSEACAIENLGESSANMLEEALRVAVQGDAHEQAARAYNNLVCVLVTSNQIHEALRYAEEGLPYCQDHELDIYMHCLTGSYIGVLDKLGRWDEAIDIAEHELAKPTLSPFNRAAPLMAAGSIYARRGNRKSAEPLLAESTLVMNDMGCNEDNLRRVEFAWLEGDTSEARKRAVTLATTPGVAAELTTELAVWLKRLGESPDNYELIIDPVRERHLRDPWQDVAAMWAELG